MFQGPSWRSKLSALILTGAFMAPTIGSARVIDSVNNYTLTYDLTKDSYIEKKGDKNANHGSKTTISLGTDDKHHGVIESPISLEVDFGSRFVDTSKTPECDDLISEAEKAELVVNVQSASCANGTCKIRVRALEEDFEEGGVTYNCANDTDVNNSTADCSPLWNGGDTKQPVSVSIPDGYTGELRIDITKLVTKGQTRFKLTTVKQNAVVLSSRESGNAPKIDVKFPSLVETDTLADKRSTVTVATPSTVTGPGSEDGIDIRYALIGDLSQAKTVYWFWHGVPNSSLMYRTVIADLKKNLEKKGVDTSEVAFLAHDMFGFGQSERIHSTTCLVGDFDTPNPTGEPLHCFEKNYQPINHFAVMANFADALNLGQGNQKVVIVAHDWGGLPGLHWASQNMSKVAGIATVDSWFVSCNDADAFPNDNVPAGGDGKSCLADSPVGYDPNDFNLQFFISAFQNPFRTASFPFSGDFLQLEQLQGGLDSFVSAHNPAANFTQNLTLGTIPAAIISLYIQPWGLGVAPPLNSNRAVITQSPRAIPFSPFGVPGISGDAVNGTDFFVAAYTAILRADTQIPKLLMAHANAALYNVPGQYEAAEQNYNKLTLACVGSEPHMIAEATPYFLAKRIADWSLAESIVVGDEDEEVNNSGDEDEIEE